MNYFKPHCTVVSLDDFFWKNPIDDIDIQINIGLPQEEINIYINTIPVPYLDNRYG